MLQGVRPSATLGKKRGATFRTRWQNALASHFEAMREVGEPIPEPSASVDYVDVAA